MSLDRYKSIIDSQGFVDERVLASCPEIPSRISVNVSGHRPTKRRARTTQRVATDGQVHISFGHLRTCLQAVVRANAFSTVIDA